LLYIAFTSNIQKRIENHNAGLTKSTAWRRPLQLVFCEHYLFEPHARKREMYFKTTAGKKAIKLMLNSTLEKLDKHIRLSILISQACASRIANYSPLTIHYSLLTIHHSLS